MKLKLLQWPNKKLREKSKEVVDFGEIRPIIPCMAKIMKKEKGAAIAAPQVGVLKRFFLTEHEVIVNPTWEPAENSTLSLVEEGCLSFPGLWAKVERHSDVQVRYQNLNERWVEKVISAFEAQVFQHEVNHLDGVLFIDLIRS